MTAVGTSGVVVSPHLDDAVLSCAGRLLRGDVTVVTVCAGVPPDDAMLSAWDAASGATSAGQRGRERLAEDDAALAILDVPTRRLDELGRHYRGSPFDVARLSERLMPLLEGVNEVWLPAGIGGHEAHVATSRAALDAVRRTAMSTVFVYADLPYALAFGWPASMTALEVELRRLGHDRAAMSPDERTLDSFEQGRKRAAVVCYRSQLALLEMSSEGHFMVRAADARELAWRLA